MKKARANIIGLALLIIVLVFLYYLMKNGWDMKLVAQDILGKK